MRQLSEEELKIFEWQLDVPGFGIEGQTKLKNTTALISRTGGLGGPLAFQLASAGVGKLILAHAGNLKHSDLNRQILMKHEGLGKPRAESSLETLKRFNPNIEIETIQENITEENAKSLVSKADIVFDCAPLFEERFALNKQCILQNKPLIDCAMYNMECQLINIIPGKTPCLNCIFPEIPKQWKRKFPVFGAVSSLIASIGAIEGLKLLTNFGPVMTNEMLYINTNTLNFQRIPIKRNPQCKTCSHLYNGEK